MATWMTHFRIADELLNRGLRVSAPEFLVGHIGPDCGLPDESGQFQPPKTVTHFLEGKTIRPELFLAAYIPGGVDSLIAEDPRDSFLLSCYLHLLTDVEWCRLVQRKKSEPSLQAIAGQPDYYSRLKSDWYGIDFHYLRETPYNSFSRLFRAINNFPDYLDLFPAGQIQKQIERISAFYCGHSFSGDCGEDYEFLYCTPRETGDFVTDTSQKLLETVLNGLPNSTVTHAP